MSTAPSTTEVIVKVGEHASVPVGLAAGVLVGAVVGAVVVGLIATTWPDGKAPLRKVLATIALVPGTLLAAWVGAATASATAQANLMAEYRVTGHVHEFNAQDPTVLLKESRAKFMVDSPVTLRPGDRVDMGCRALNHSDGSAYSCVLETATDPDGRTVYAA